MNIGIIGAGAVAKFLLEQLNGGKTELGTVKALLVRNKEKYKELEEQYHIQLYTDVELFLATDIDLVVEAAELEAVKTLVPTIVRQKPVVLISIGALAEGELLTELQQLAQQHQQRVYLPSGAIGGLDLLQNAHVLGRVTDVMLTTRKPASSLTADPVNEPTIIFKGSAKEAIAKYPKNMNVSIVLALAGIGFEATKVKLVADPHVTQNIHQIAIAGDFGEATIEVKNNPLPANPKTSYLAAMSILGTLNRLKTDIKIGF
ncbi:MAG: aspartate dehydrogenase [Lysinibacillus sp.]